MSGTKKSSIYIFSLIISFFSCYALYKLYERSLDALEKNPEIDNVAAVSLAMIISPILLFIFNVVFYIVVYEKTIKKYPKQISSWRILLLNKKHWSLNLIRVLLYLLCLSIIADMVGTVPIWLIITLVLNFVAYGYWMLQMVRERYLMV